MHFVVIGLNHTTAPVDVREKLYVPEDAMAGLFKELKELGVAEALVLSTCNRTEIYVSGSSLETARHAVAGALMHVFGIEQEWLEKYTYTFSEQEACRHLFLVAAGLDSMVIGEPQILGQVKDAYRLAGLYETSGPFLEKVFNRAFQVAKRIRTETKIGYNPVSISSMAVELSRKIFGEFSQKKILVIGAGEMCEIALKHFKKEGLQEIFIANRTFQKAQQLAEEVIGLPYPFEEIPELLLKVDMVLSSTGAEEPIIDRKLVTTVMKKRKNRPLFFIDIAVPRDVDPGVNDIENTYLYDIDDLKELSQAHLADRVQESEKAHAIVEEEVHKFTLWLAQLEMNPLIKQITEKLETLRSSELKRTAQKLKNADEETLKQMDLLTRAIVNKLVHPHIVMIKRNGNPTVLDIMKTLFQFEDEHEKEMGTGDEGK